MEERIELDGQNIDIVEAEFMTVKQSTVKAIEAGTAEMQQICALSVDAEKVDITQGAIGFMKAGDVNLNQCIAAVNVGNKTDVNFSLCPVAIGKEEAKIKRSAAGVVLGSNVEVKNSAALIVVGKNIEGNVTTLFDWKSALAVTAVAGGIFGLLRLFLRK